MNRAKPRDRWKLRLGVVLFVSLFFHLVSFKEMVEFGANRSKFATPKSEPLKIRVLPKDDPTIQKSRKLLEARQEKTAKPKEAEHLGEVDHIAKRETRVDTTKIRDKALDPAKMVGNPSKATSPTKASLAKSSAKPTKPGIGKLKMSGTSQSVYSSLMPTAEELRKQVDAGYVGYVNDKVALGDAVDINTTEFRFIGYFTNLRKEIELVWNYPYDAAVRGMQGSVGLVFTINKDGRAEGVKVLNSSGYKILDQAIVDAIALASPFAPLPSSLKKEKLTIKGNFTYTLGNMIGGY